MKLISLFVCIILIFLSLPTVGIRASDKHEVWDEWKEIVVEEEHIEGGSLSDFTIKSERRDMPDSAQARASIDIALIHPDNDVEYEELNQNMRLEKELKTNYDIIYVEISFRQPLSSFSIYEFRNESKIIVENKTEEALDFYDIDRRVSATAEFVTSGSTPRFRGKVNRFTVYGYLLFPKVFDVDNVNRITFLNNYFKSKIELDWDIERIDALIEILH